MDRLLASVGGSVDREETTNARDGSIDRSRLVLRVPVEKFDETKRALGRLGKLTSSTESEKDVTTEVIDTGERVQTLQNSLDRLQRYQRSAKDVTALIRYEDQITARQSELQSLKAQQTYLTSRTTMSTITLDLSTPETYVAPPGALDDAGFLAGLQGGWHALGRGRGRGADRARGGAAVPRRGAGSSGCRCGWRAAAGPPASRHGLGRHAVRTPSG